MLSLIILFIAALFFPPLWFIFAIYLIWWIFSAKKRRKNIIEPLILELIRRKHHRWVNLPHIHYEALQQYAIEHGAKVAFNDRNAPNNNSMNFVFEIDGSVYPILIHKLIGGTASIMVQHDNSNKYLSYHYEFDDSDQYSQVLSSLIKHSLMFNVHSIAAYIDYDSVKCNEYFDSLDASGGYDDITGGLMMCFEYNNEEELITVFAGKEGLLTVTPTSLRRQLIY